MTLTPRTELAIVLAEANGEDLKKALCTVYRQDGSPYGDDHMGLIRWVPDATHAVSIVRRIVAALPAA